MLYAQPQGDYAMSELYAELRQAKEAKWYRRLKIIQLSMTGMRVPQLAEQFNLCRVTIRSYIKAYNEGGIAGLRPKKSSGRPPKVGQLSREDWSEILRRTPDQYEKLQTGSRQWTLGLLVRYAKEYLQQEVCFQTIFAALKRRKYRTGRSKLRGGSPDPEYQVKRKRGEDLRSLPSRGN